MTNTETRACQEFVTGSIAELRELQPAKVVVASAADIQVQHGDRQFMRDDGTAIASETERLAAWASALEATLAQLPTEKTDLLVVRPVPRLGGAGAAPDASRLSYGRTFAGAVFVSREFALPERDAIAAAQDHASSQAGATAVDLFTSICTEERCETSRSGDPVYRDQMHLPVAESERLTGRWLSILEKSESS